MKGLKTYFYLDLDSSGRHLKIFVSRPEMWSQLQFHCCDLFFYFIISMSSILGRDL